MTIVTLRVVVSLLVVGAMGFLVGFRMGSRDQRSRQLSALVDQLLGWEDKP